MRLSCGFLAVVFAPCGVHPFYFHFIMHLHICQAERYLIIAFSRMQISPARVISPEMPGVLVDITVNSAFACFLFVPTLCVKPGQNSLLRSTNAGKESKKGCNLVTLGVKYASVCACYVNTQQNPEQRVLSMKKRIVSLALTLCLLAAA